MLLPIKRLATGAAAVAVVAQLPAGVHANADAFEWFRCDSCRATLHQVEMKFNAIGPALHDKKKYPAYQVLELLEEVCEDKEVFSKRQYGVKEHEGKKYLFGPGVKDHLRENEGFGQMGMGDYDERLRSFCHMFIE